MYTVVTFPTTINECWGVVKNKCSFCHVSIVIIAICIGENQSPLLGCWNLLHMIGSSSDLCDRIFFGSINSFHHVGIKRFHYFSLHWKGQSLFIVFSVALFSGKTVELFLNQGSTIIFSYYIFLTLSFAYSIRDRFEQVLQLERFKQVLRLVYRLRSR